MIVHSHANILDFKEKAFSLYFLCIANLFCRPRLLMGARPLAPRCFQV